MRKRIGAIVILAIFIVAVRLFARSTSLVENIYANTIYKTLVPPLSRLTGVFPFSLAEIILVLLVIWLLIELIIRQYSRRREQSDGLLNSFLTSIIVIGLLYLAFQCLWGLNYQRLQFAEIAGLDTRPVVSIKELNDLGRSLVDQANHLRTEVEEGNDGVMRLADNQREVLDQAIDGYAVLAAIYPQLEGQYGRPKGLIFSPAISYTGMYGFYIPFTGEANINTEIPECMLPFSACHEMAHQRGIAREGEANFVGYLSCSMNPRTDFQYSGTLLALTYVLNAIKERDEVRFEGLRDSLVAGVTRDLQDIREFGERHRGPWSRVSTRVNDFYLKANSQSAGVHSYNGIVDLLVATHRQLPAELNDRPDT